jgi:hypothetical protein
MVYTKVLFLNAIYNFVANKFFIQSRLEFQIYVQNF